MVEHFEEKEVVKVKRKRIEVVKGVQEGLLRSHEEKFGWTNGRKDERGKIGYYYLYQPRSTTGTAGSGR